MALEIAGLVLGAASALAALRGALDTALLIDAYFDDEKSNCGYLALRYHIEKTRLDLWRRAYKIDDPEACPLRYKPEAIQKLVVQTLALITQLLDESQNLVEKYKIAAPAVPPLENNTNNDAVKGSGLSFGSRSHDAAATALSKLRVKPKSKFRWTIKGKAEFDDKVSRISTLVRDLQDFTVDASESRSLDRALPSMSLKDIVNAEILQLLNDPKNGAGAALATSARVKLLQNPTRLPDGSATVLTADQLRFWKHAGSSVGTLRLSTASVQSIWIEWSIIDSGSAAPEYIRRIKALGYLLEEAGNPALRLPVCYGIFDDLAYEAEYEERRIGYVFGAPSPSPSPTTIPAQPPPPRYDGNFRDHPPRTLSDLIQDGKSFPVPLLGDRFALAATLATAFSNFHSAGWLHKGFHSGAIIFLAQASSSSASQESVVIKVTDPFITGFQYARPAGAESLPRGPLEIGELEHYYHPLAAGGFSRRLDLYSLGVVLCEIGRWGLVKSTVSPGTRRKLVSRAAWRKYMVSKVLPDIGWRMGEKYQSAVRTLLECRLPDDVNDGFDDGGFFEQQYFEKVIQPLSACSA